jgi:hypothetical protein
VQQVLLTFWRSPKFDNYPLVLGMVSEDVLMHKLPSLILSGLQGRQLHSGTAEMPRSLSCLVTWPHDEAKEP